MSFSRTLSKILVGTTVGVLVRKGCIKLANKYTGMIELKDAGGAAKARVKAFLSPEYVRRYTYDYNKNYVNALGSVSGIVVSLFTNFLIDAPLTQILTNKLYGKINPKSKQISEQKQNHNLLALHLAKTGFNGAKTVSFSGNTAVSGIEEARRLAEKYKDKMTWKMWFWSKVASNPSGMLMHTGALGWAASSAAQITGLAFNDKIDSNKKKFLIPQEFADAVFNIALYYALTLSVSRYVKHLFESGKIRIKSVMDRIEQEAYEKRKSLGKDFHLGNIFDGKAPVKDKLEKLTSARNKYLTYKNGACILATLAASVLSCNILTPYLRNIYASYRQDAARKNSIKINTKLFDMKQKLSNIKTGLHEEALTKNQSKDKTKAPFEKFMV